MGKVYVVDPNSRKLPYELTVVVGMCAFLDFFCMNQIMPNVPFMIADFFPEIDSTQIGYYSGYLTSCYNLGGIVGNLFWGWFSDTYGRKPTIVISLLGTAVFCQLFGLAPNYTLAIIFRTCWGLMNSMLGVVKTYIAELCNVHTLAKGFSIMSAAGGLARIVGPLVGGFLSKPEENFPALVHLMPWLRKVRYWIPCFVGGVLCLFTAIFTAFAAPETLSREKAKKAKQEKKRNAKKVVIIDKKLKNGESITLEEEMLVELSHDSYFYLVRDRLIFLSCLSYTLVSTVQSAQDSLLSLYLINEPQHGGFGFDQTDIGWLYTGIGPIQIIFNLVVELMSYQDVFFWSSLLYAIFLLFYPIVSLFNQSPEALQWFVILIATMCCLLSRIFSFTTINVLINNSTYSDYRGKVNGLGQVFAAFARFIGPSLGSNIFAWSISEERPFPFHYGFTYYLLGIMMIFIAFYIYLLPESINRPKGSVADVFKKKEQELKVLANDENSKKDDLANKDPENQNLAVIATREISKENKKDEINMNTDINTDPTVSPSTTKPSESQ